MVKPHEEQWEYDSVIRALRMPDNDDSKRDWRGVLASAAPDMARALLEALEWDRRSRECPEAVGRHPWEAMRAALRKAGVI